MQRADLRKGVLGWKKKVKGSHKNYFGAKKMELS